MHKSICFNYKYNSEYKERISLIEEVGFDGVFLYSQYNPSDYIELICKSSLSIDSLHLPYKKLLEGKTIDSRYVNVLWQEGEESNNYVKELLDEVKFAHDYGIRTVVMHVTGGDNPPPVSKWGIKNIANILDACEKYNITLCLENLRRLDYLDFVYKNLESEKLMFCFDSGHANAMTKNVDEFPWGNYRNKLYYLHLNDNNGLKDQHMIPFSGNINWDDLMKVIFEINKDIVLTLEVRSSEELRNLYDERQYLKLCFNSLVRIQNILEG